jgi:hypothetical protein
MSIICVAIGCVECDRGQTSGVTFDNGDGGEVTICDECLKKAVAL